MHKKTDRNSREFDRKVLTQFVDAIRHAEEAVKDLGSASEALVADFAFKNRAPDFEYVDDLEHAFYDIQVLQHTLDGGQGPLSTLRKLSNRFSHDQIVVPRSWECGYCSAPTPMTVRESLTKEGTRDRNGDS